jgi:hypothetical protein
MPGVVAMLGYIGNCDICSRGAGTEAPEVDDDREAVSATCWSLGVAPIAVIVLVFGGILRRHTSRHREVRRSAQQPPGGLRLLQRELEPSCPSLVVTRAPP